MTYAQHLEDGAILTWMERGFTEHDIAEFREWCAKSVAIVFGTYNRLDMLKGAVASVRRACQKRPYSIIIIDGGSTDGTREWLHTQSRVAIIQQEPPLTGAVRAFNLGFGLAVDQGFKYVMHLNDDAEIMGEGAIDHACEILDGDSKIGEVAFGYDLYRPGRYSVSQIGGKPYGNFGLIRPAAGIAVAKEQGDPMGRAWWNPIYRTYGADTEFGVQLWRLGWRVHPAPELQVHDLNAADDLRKLNEGDFDDSKLFWSRWRDWRPE